jgi:hypothetical protein
MIYSCPGDQDQEGAGEMRDQGAEKEEQEDWGYSPAVGEAGGLRYQCLL